MLKVILVIIIAMLIVGMLAGGIHLYRVGQKNKKEMSLYLNKEIKYDNKLEKVLVVYYSLSGNTKYIAQSIAKQTNADVFEIETLDVIKTNLSFYFKIKKQLNSRKYPEIKSKIADFSKYDIVFVGFPVWWYTIATPGLSFLQQTDFMGKKVVPFSTQGSNYGSFFTDFKKNAKNAQILDGMSFNNMSKEYNNAVNNKINDWLNKL